MKTSLTLLFALAISSGSLLGQNKLYLGMAAGQGASFPYEATTVSRMQNYAIGLEGGYQLFSKLYFVARPEYQYRYFLYAQPNLETGRSLQFLSTHFTLQWKGRWGYAGLGMLASRMLGQREEMPALLRCGVGVDPEHWVDPAPVLVDYSSAGTVLQLGITPPISQRSHALLEFNAI